MILALSGRRIDAMDTKQARFPLGNVPSVKNALHNLFCQKKVTSLASSAACGADLLALSEAGALGLRRRIVIPSGRKNFRETSVTDRPGDWGGLYDEIMDQVEAAGDLVTLNGLSDDEAYSAVNLLILDEAFWLGQQLGQPVCAALVWDGVSRGSDDFTEKFGIEARIRNLELFEVLTK